MPQNRSSILDDIVARPALRQATDDADVLRTQIEHLLPTLLAALPERQRTVLTLYYGLEQGGVTATLQAIGKHLGVTGQQVRNLQIQIIGRLSRQIANHRRAATTPDPADLRALLLHAQATGHLSMRVCRQIVQHYWEDLAAIGLTSTAAFRAELWQPDGGRVRELWHIGAGTINELRAVLGREDEPTANTIGSTTDSDPER